MRANAGVLLHRERVGTSLAREHGLMELLGKEANAGVSGLDVTLTVAAFVWQP